MSDSDVRLRDFDVQMRVWGYSVWSAPTDGSLPMEKHEAVLVAEDPDYLVHKGGWWDHRATYLLGIERWHGELRLEPPDWWALGCAPDLALLGVHNSERLYPT